MQFKNIKCLLIDCDNTIIDWFSFAGKSLQAMTKAISIQTKLPEAEITKKIQAIYQKYQSIEYPLVIDEIFHDHPNLINIINSGKTAFSNCLKKNIKTYPNIPEILNHLKKDLILIILTDAPTISCYSRLKKSNLISNFTAIIGQPYPDNSLFKPQFRKPSEHPIKILASPTLKPNTPLLSLLPQIPELSFLSLSPNTISKHLAIWGDNPNHDGLLALRWKIPWFNATYGIPTKNQIESIKPFSPFTSSNNHPAINQENEKTNNFPLEIKLKTPSDLLQYFR